MPKKPPRNAFYFFMVDYKEQQRKKGINMGTLAEVAEAAGPIWRDAPPPVRAKFEEMAKREKQKRNVPEAKFTSTGIPFSVIENQMREQQEAEEAELKDIQDIVRKNVVRNDIYEMDIYIVDVNSLCKTGQTHLIGESTVLRFTLADGIKDNYHELINPGVIPTGFAYDVKLGCEELGLDMPDESNRSNYMQILANTIDYLKQHDPRSNLLPPLFTMPDKVLAVQDYISQMCSRAGEDESLFRVYKLDKLFFTLINAIKSGKNEGFPKESLALATLKKDAFKYTPGLGCEHHESCDKSLECSLSRARRWAHTVLDSCCPLVGIELLPGRHVPHEYDIDSILTYKEAKNERMGPSIAGINMGAMSLCTTNDSFADASSSFNDSASLDVSLSEMKREHKPLRMPKTDYSQAIRLAPELTEANFPKLTGGLGRGRGMPGLHKLRQDK